MGMGCVCAEYILGWMEDMILIAPIKSNVRHLKGILLDVDLSGTVLKK